MNIYCFSTLSFAKLQFKSVINKAFHKHGVASFTDAWIETLDFETIDMSKCTNYILGLKEEAGAWVETADGKYRAYVYINKASASEVTVSVKRYKM